MTGTEERRCKECGGATHEIHVMDKVGMAGEFAADLEYSLPEARRSFWTGKYAPSGKVRALLCEGCGQITLYGKPEAGK